MAFFRKSKDAEYDALAAGPAMDPHWAEHEEGGFLRFTDLDPEEMGLSGASGVYVLWHGGFRPEWVYVGHDKNLASAMHRAAGNKDIFRLSCSESASYNNHNLRSYFQRTSHLHYSYFHSSNLLILFIFFNASKKAINKFILVFV